MMSNLPYENGPYPDASRRLLRPAPLLTFRDQDARANPQAASSARRPSVVPGPDGQPLTMADLPSPDTRRWIARRKAEVIAAIAGDLLTEVEACRRYGLSPEELALWRQSIARGGVAALRITRIQVYREQFTRRERTTAHFEPQATVGTSSPNDAPQKTGNADSRQ